MLTHEKIVDAVRKAAREFTLTKAVSLLTIIGLKHRLEKELAKPVDVIHAPISFRINHRNRKDGKRSMNKRTRTILK